MVKYAQAIRCLLPLNCLNVFDDFVGLSLKGLTSSRILTTDPLENQYGKMPKQSSRKRGIRLITGTHFCYLSYE